MLTQEEYVHRVLELQRQGWSIKEIAAEVEYRPATVSKWLKAGGPPPVRGSHRTGVLDALALVPGHPWRTVPPGASPNAGCPPAASPARRSAHRGQRALR